MSEWREVIIILAGLIAIGNLWTKLEAANKEICKLKKQLNEYLHH